MQSDKITELGERLCTHTHTEGDKDWLLGLEIAYVCGAEPRCKVFHYLSIKLQLDLSESRLPLFHSRLLLTIP